VRRDVLSFHLPEAASADGKTNFCIFLRVLRAFAVQSVDFSGSEIRQVADKGRSDVRYPLERFRLLQFYFQGAGNRRQ
jgi:hypothetical protein